jgi:hypothetical protein
MLMTCGPSCSADDTTHRLRQHNTLAGRLLRNCNNANHDDEDRCACLYGHFATGGIDDRIDATLPPVFSPNTVPRS